MRPSLLAVTPLAPWPMRDGHTLRVAQLLAELSHLWAITLVAPAGPVPAAVAEHVLVAEPAGGSTRPWHFDAGPLGLGVDHAARARRFDGAVVWAGAEAVWFDRPHLPPAVVDLIDCNALEFWRAARTCSGARAKLVQLRELAASIPYARRTFRSFAATVCVAPTDAKWLRAMGGGGRVHVVPNGVALRSPPPAPAPDPVLAFTGSLDYHPNVDAAVLAAREIWPLIQKAQPGARFVIAGRQPVEAVRSLGSEPGISVEGDIPDMAAVFARTRVAIAPMRAGSGIKNKILEAWAASRPVVMTPVAASGLALPAGHKELVCSGGDALGKTAAWLLSDPAAAARLGAAARMHVEQHYSWAQQAARLTELIEASQRAAREV